MNVTVVFFFFLIISLYFVYKLPMLRAWFIINYDYIFIFLFIVNKFEIRYNTFLPL